MGISLSAIPEFLITKTIELRTGFAYFMPIGSIAAIAPEGVIAINHKFWDLSKEAVKKGLITFEELVLEGVCHEMLHKILFEVEDIAACRGLDKIAYEEESQWNHGGM